MIFNFIKKYKWELIAGFFLVSLFFLSRLISLTKLPIFVDEAIYLRWAQIAKNDANWRFISLTDGKQPLFIWLAMVMMKLIKDPIYAGRFVSVLAGFGSMIAIWWLSFLLFKSKRQAFFSSLLYLIFPFAMVYDRMALMDTLVALFSLLSLIFAVYLVKTKRLDVALILGGILGGGVLTKTSGFLSIYCLPLVLLLLDFRSKKWRSNLFKWIGLALLSVAISQMFYSVLRLSPFFHIVNEKNSLFVYSFKKWWQIDPFYYFKPNLSGLTNWLIKYLTWPLAILSLISFISVKHKIKEKLLLFFWFLMPFSALVVFGRILYPRFILFMCLPLLVLVAYSLDFLWSLVKKPLYGWLITILFLAWPIYFSYVILFYPVLAPLPESDKAQYITSWPAGYGIKEIVYFAKQQAKDQKIFIATEGTFGLMPASLELYLWNNPNVEVKGFFPIAELPDQVLEKAKIMPTFIVFNETQTPDGSWPMKLVSIYPRPNTRYSLKLYQVFFRRIDE